MTDYTYPSTTNISISIKIIFNIMIDIDNSRIEYR